MIKDKKINKVTPFLSFYPFLSNRVLNPVRVRKITTKPSPNNCNQNLEKNKNCE
jgi:hypothetical protein